MAKKTNVSVAPAQAVAQVAAPAVKRVSIVDVETGNTVSYDTLVNPKESTVGNCYFNTLNYKAIAKCQEKGLRILDEESSNDAVIKAFKIAYKIDLAPEDVGNRGGNWATPAEREATTVLVDNIPYNPAFSQAALKKAEAIESARKARAEARALAIANNPEMALADTSAIPGKAEILAKIRESTKMYSKKEIIASLSKKVTLPQAHALYKEAGVEKQVSKVPDLF